MPKKFCNKMKNGDFIYASSHFYFGCCDCGKRHAFIIDKVINPTSSPTLQSNTQLLAIRVYDDLASDKLNRKLYKWDKK